MTTEQYAAAYTAGFDNTVRFLLRFGCRNDQDAADFAQTAWLKGWIYRSQIRSEASIAAWINTIALNVFRVQARSADVRRRVIPRLDTSDVRFHTQVCEMDTDEMDRRKLMRMVGDRDRELLRDYYVDGYTAAELKSRHGLSRPAIKTRIMRASERLRKQCQR